MDKLTMAQSAHRATAVNTAVLIGYRVLGLGGYSALPLIEDAGIQQIERASGFGAEIDWGALLIFAGAFWGLFRYETNPLYVMAGSGLLGQILDSL